MIQIRFLTRSDTSVSLAHSNNSYHIAPLRAMSEYDLVGSPDKVKRGAIAPYEDPNDKDRNNDKERTGTLRNSIGGSD